MVQRKCKIFIRIIILVILSYCMVLMIMNGNMFFVSVLVKSEYFLCIKGNVYGIMLMSTLKHNCRFW